MNIQAVGLFNLLGSIKGEEGTCKSELARRLALGKSSMTGLSRIWKDRAVIPDLPNASLLALGRWWMRRDEMSKLLAQ